MDNLSYKILVSIPGYEILHELGRGGMSTVYLAVQESLQRNLALKVMSSTLSVDPSFKDRFMREGRTLGQLTHPNIVTVYDIGISASRYFIAMEYVGGGTLGERIEKGLPLHESLRIVRDIGRALNYAHRRGFVHRDVKPSNILFREDDTPVLADFGIARSVDSNTHLTKTGISVGTPNYMSPEQVTGQSIDGRSDLYSLGIVLYEMLTGAPPFHGESAIATSLKHITEPLPKLPERLSFLQPVMERVLAKTPGDRFADLQEFIEALHRAVAADGGDGPTGARTELSKKTLLYDERRDKPTNLAGKQKDPPRPESVSRTDSGAGAPRTSAWLAVFRRHPRWKLSGGLSVAGVLAAGAALMLSEPALDPATQRAVDHLLRIAERHLTDGQLIEPEGFNAFETYRGILEIAPDYKEALSGLHQIAEQLEAEARAKRKTGYAHESLALIDQGLQVEPEHKGLLGLRDEITHQLDNEKRQREIAAWLAKAEQQFNDWRLVEPPNDNAAESYRAALALDSKNPHALQGLTRIAARLEGLARTKQDGGDLAGALADVERGLKVHPQHQGLVALKHHLAIESQLARAEGLLRDDHLVTPPSDNAFEHYQKVLNDEPNKEQAQRARIGLRDVAARMTTLARQDWEAGRGLESLDRIDTGLRLFKGLPGYRDMQALRGEIERDQKITTLLAAGAQQFKDSKLFEPGKDNAFASYQAVLELDPGNVTALEGLQAIADQQQMVAMRAEAAGDLDGALAALSRGRKAVEDHPGLVSLEAAVRRTFQAQAARKQRLAELLAQAEEQLAAGQVTLPAGNNAYESYQEVLGYEPGNEAALRGIQLIMQTLEQRAREEAVQAAARNAEEKPPNEDPIPTLLAKASQQIASSKLTRPAGDNAYETLQAVFALDPDNREAKAVVSTIAARYAAFARDRLQAGNTREALVMVTRGLEVDAQHRALLTLKAELTEPEGASDAKVASLLAKAEQQLEAGHTTAPPDNNAFGTLSAILRLQPGNRQAQAGLRTIAAQYEVAIKAELNTGNERKALALAEESLRFFPEHKELVALQRDLANQQGKEDTVRALLARAERQLEAGQWTHPPGNNAFDTLQKALMLDPNNRQAEKKLASISQRCHKFARTVQQKGDAGSALSTVEECLQFFPGDANLLAFRDELKRPRAEQPTPIRTLEARVPEENSQQNSDEATPPRRRVIGTF